MLHGRRGRQGVRSVVWGWGTRATNSSRTCAVSGSRRHASRPASVGRHPHPACGARRHIGVRRCRGAPLLLRPLPSAYVLPLTHLHSCVCLAASCRRAWRERRVNALHTTVLQWNTPPPHLGGNNKRHRLPHMLLHKVHAHARLVGHQAGVGGEGAHNYKCQGNELASARLGNTTPARLRCRRATVVRECVLREQRGAHRVQTPRPRGQHQRPGVSACCGAVSGCRDCAQPTAGGSHGTAP
jgi:hypothetical protein